MVYLAIKDTPEHHTNHHKTPHYHQQDVEDIVLELHAHQDQAPGKGNGKYQEEKEVASSS